MKRPRRLPGQLPVTIMAALVGAAAAPVAPMMPGQLGTVRPGQPSRLNTMPKASRAEAFRLEAADVQCHGPEETARLVAQAQAKKAAEQQPDAVFESPDGTRHEVEYKSTADTPEARAAAAQQTELYRNTVIDSALSTNGI